MPYKADEKLWDGTNRKNFAAKAFVDDNPIGNLLEQIEECRFHGAVIVAHSGIRLKRSLTAVATALEPNPARWTL